MKKTTYHLMSVIISLALAMGWYASAGARAVKVAIVGNGQNLVITSSQILSGDFATVTISGSGTATAPITVAGGRMKCLVISGQYIAVSGVDVTGCNGHGVFISGKHVLFQDSNVHDTVRDNKSGAVCGNGAAAFGSAVKVYVGGEDIAIKNNRVYQNCGEGIGITRGIAVKVSGNTVYDNYSVNIYIDNSHHVEVIGNTSSCGDRNYLRSDNTFAFGILLGIENYTGWGNQLHDVLVDRNVIEGCRPIRLYSQLGTVSPANVTISNNLFTNVATPYVSVAGATVINNVRVDYTATPPTDLGTATSTLAVTPTKTLIVPTATQMQTATPTTVPTGNNSVNVRVAGGSDDVEESATGWMYLDSSDLELIYDTNAQKVGLRFNGVNIPKNAVILNAYIQFTVDKASANATTLTIQGLKTPNAVAFTTKSRNLSSRAKTTASVKWTPVSWLTPGVIGVEQRTPNMASIIQEIVNQSGWVSGNSFGVIISGNGKRVAKSYEGGATGAPVLHIEYTTGAALSMQLPEETATPMETPTESSVPVLPSATPTYYAFPTPTLEATIQPAPELVYDDTDGSFVYSSNWLSFDAPQAYGGSYKATAAAGASVTLDFTGQSFSVLYTDGQDYKGMSVYVDGELVETILRKTDTITYQQRWDYPGLLTYGTHTVQLVFTDGNGTLDAVIVR